MLQGNAGSTDKINISFLLTDHVRRILVFATGDNPQIFINSIQGLHLFLTSYYDNSYINAYQHLKEVFDAQKHKNAGIINKDGSFLKNLEFQFAQAQFSHLMLLMDRRGILPEKIAYETI